MEQRLKIRCSLVKKNVLSVTLGTEGVTFQAEHNGMVKKQKWLLPSESAVSLGWALMGGGQGEDTILFSEKSEAFDLTLMREKGARWLHCTEHGSSDWIEGTYFCIKLTDNTRASLSRLILGTQKPQRQGTIEAPVFGL